MLQGTRVRQRFPFIVLCCIASGKCASTLKGCSTDGHFHFVETDDWVTDPIELVISSCECFPSAMNFSPRLIDAVHSADRKF